MVKKVHFFDSVSSYLPIGSKENRQNASANLASDWERLSNEPNVYLNGQPLSTFREYFKSDEGVIEFFDKEFHQKLGLPDGQKQAVLTYLASHFQQQGFMYPVSNTLTYTLMEAGKNDGYGLTPDDKTSVKHMNITVSSEGLTIQELVEVKQVTCTLGKAYKELKPDPDTDTTAAKPYVIKAEGTLHFNFKGDASDPVITVKSNKISVGRADLEPVLRPIDFITKIMNFIAQICGFNKVEVEDDESQNKPSM